MWTEINTLWSNIYKSWKSFENVCPLKKEKKKKKNTANTVTDAVLLASSCCAPLSVYFLSDLLRASSFLCCSSHVWLSGSCLYPPPASKRWNGQMFHPGFWNNICDIGYMRESAAAWIISAAVTAHLFKHIWTVRNWKDKRREKNQWEENVWGLWLLHVKTLWNMNMGEGLQMPSYLIQTCTSWQEFVRVKFCNFKKSAHMEHSRGKTFDLFYTSSYTM